MVVVRKFLGAKDADWQAARPTTPYTPPRQADTGQATGAGGATAAAGAVDEMDEAHEDPQGGMSAHLFNLEADGAATPDQPAEGGEYDAPADMASLVDEAFDEATANSAPKLPPRQRVSVSRRRPRLPPTNRRWEQQLPTKRWLGRLRLATRALRCSARLPLLRMSEGRDTRARGLRRTRAA